MNIITYMNIIIILKVNIKKVCWCGEYTFLPHVVGEITEFNGKKQATCIDCKAVLDLSSSHVIAPILPTSSKEIKYYSIITFIDLNGVIILSEKDYYRYANIRNSLE